jgi:hypothetical protein
MTPTPPYQPTTRTGSRRTIALVLAVVVVLGAVGVGVAIGRSHSSSSSSPTSPTTLSKSQKAALRCAKKKKKKRKKPCPATSPSTPAGSTDQTPPNGALASLNMTTFHSKMGLSTGVQLWEEAASKQDSDMAGIAATGAKWVRTALHWSDVEPTSANQDDWSRADRLVTDGQKDGVSIVFDITNAPAWAGGTQAGEFSSDPQLYADFAAKVATRYKNTVRVFELGNEPNHSNYVTNPDPATYTKILQLAYPAIKKADPNAFVLIGGIGGIRDSKGDIDPLTFVRGLYQDGAKGNFDGIAYHPYTYPELPTQEITTGDRGWSRMLSVRSIMVQNGDASKSIWVTEFGAPTNGPGGVSEQQQASILTNGFNLWNTYTWGGAMCWFSWRDKGNDPTTHKDWFGLVDNSGAKKPSYAAFGALARG